MARTVGACQASAGKFIQLPRVTLTARDVFPVPEDVQIGLYRIAQEAMSNVVKHARATHVTLALETQGGVVRLRIEDDGSAPEAAEGSSDGCGLGMDIMRERAESMGARLTVERGHEGGLRVEVAWPAPTEAAANG